MNYSTNKTQELGFFLLSKGIPIDTPLTAFENGLSNDNFRLDYQGKSIVLRINRNAKNLGVGRKNEVINWQLAAVHHLSSRIVAVSDDHNYFLSEYLPQKERHHWHSRAKNNGSNDFHTNEINPGYLKLASVSKKDNELESSNDVSLLLELLVGLSRLPKPQNEVTLNEQWQIYLTSIEKEFQSLSPIFGGLSSSKLKTFQQEVYYRVNKLKFISPTINTWLAEMNECQISSQYCHRDLNPTNILFSNDNKLVCIDFEYACASHPLLDLITVIATHKLSVVERKILIKEYVLQNKNVINCRQIHVVYGINLYWLFAACWALLQSLHTKKDFTSIGLMNIGN